MRVIGMAEEYVKKKRLQKGQIWCVYDKDSFPAQHFNGVVERAEKLNNRIQSYNIMRHGVTSA